MTILHVPHLLIQPITAIKLMLHAVLASTVALGAEDVAIALGTLPQDPGRLITTPTTLNIIVTQTYIQNVITFI